MSVAHQRWLEVSSQLRPRDLEIVRALVEFPNLPETEIAALLGLSTHNLRTRLKFAFVLLGCESRLMLFALYHTAILGRCCCSAAGGGASAPECP